MKTGQDVIETGLYASECCLKETFFEKGKSATRCPRCSRLCEWEVVDVTPAEAAESEKVSARAA